MIRKKLRAQAVAQSIAENPNFSISELAQRFNVSEMTIRRDLKYLEENELFQDKLPAAPQPPAGAESGGSTHGSYAACQAPALPAALASSEARYEFRAESLSMADEKSRIADYAVSLIEPNDVLLLDTGTTVDLVAKRLPTDIPLTVICYNVNVMARLYRRENIKILMGGGYYHRISQSFESAENVEFLRRLRANKMFVSVSGVEKLGLTCSSQYEVITKQTALECSMKKILLTDSSKFGVIKSSYFASIESMQLIVTDTGLSSEWVEYIQSRNIPLKLV